MNEPNVLNAEASIEYHTCRGVRTGWWRIKYSCSCNAPGVYRVTVVHAVNAAGYLLREYIPPINIAGETDWFPSPRAAASINLLFEGRDANYALILDQTVNIELAVDHFLAARWEHPKDQI